ncbi:MAG: hypothetical protein ACRD3K_04695 [Edaphobacter sp.]
MRGRAGTSLRRFPKLPCRRASTEDAWKHLHLLYNSSAARGQSAECRTVIEGMVGTAMIVLMLGMHAQD